MLFGLTRAFQNGMTWPNSTKDHRAAPPQAKGLGASQILWWGLNQGDTHPKVTWHHPSHPWKFHSNWSTHSKASPHYTQHKNLIANTPPPLYGNRWHKSKTKMHLSLKIQFQVGSVFLQNCKIIQTNLPHSNPPHLSTPAVLHLGPQLHT